jgi:hypothetical protein
MKAQFYTETADYVRIFNLREVAWRQMIMDCNIPEKEPGLEHADAALRRCGLRRTSAWKHYPSAHMYETQVSFNRPKKKTNQLKK